jgi:hypothetical protein
MPYYEENPYGFCYGGAEIVRVCSDEKKGWVVLQLKTRKELFNIYVTKTGKVRIHSEYGNEWIESNICKKKVKS